MYSNDSKESCASRVYVVPIDMYRGVLKEVTTL